MNKIKLVLIGIILLAAAPAFAVTGPVVFGDPGNPSKLSTDGTDAFISIAGGLPGKALRQPDLNQPGGPQVYDAILAALISNGELPTAWGLAWLTAANQATAQNLIRAGVVEQPIGLVENEYELVPSSGQRIFTTIYSESDINVLFGAETGNEKACARWEIYNPGSYTLHFVDTPNNVRTNGDLYLGPKGIAIFIRTDDNSEWVMEDPRSTYVLSGGYQMSPLGVGQFAKGRMTVSDDTILSITDLNKIIIVTGEADLTLPDGVCSSSDTTDWGAEISPWLEVFKYGTADTVSLKFPSTSSNKFVLPNGTALDVGDELDLASTNGSTLCIGCIADKVWGVKWFNGTPTDGGPADGGSGTTPLTDPDVIGVYYYEQDATDESAKGNDLTENNSPTYGTSSPPQGAYYVEGVYSSSQTLTSSSSDFNQLTTGAFTFATWVYYAGDTGYVIFSKGYSTGYLGLTLFRNATDNCLSLLLSANGTTAIIRKTGTDSMPYGEFVHVGLTYDESTFRVYLNGYEHTGGSFPLSYTNGIYDTSEDFTLMKGCTYPGNIQHFTGFLDETYVNGRAFTDEEMLELATNGCE